MRCYDVYYNWCVVFHFTHDYDMWDGVVSENNDVKIIHLLLVRLEATKPSQMIQFCLLNMLYKQNTEK